MRLWEQHRVRYSAGGATVRHIPYLRFRELTDGILDDAEMAALGRLQAKQASGAVLDHEETARLTAIAHKWPVRALKA